MMKRQSSGLHLYSKLRIITFTPTDLPEPVVPATNKCGILLKSATTASPAISLPNTIGNEPFMFWKRSLATTSDIYTVSRPLFGSSKPMYGLPGIASTTRTAITDSARAKSLDRPEIRLTFTPGARSNSKRVITGPG